MNTLDIPMAVSGFFSTLVRSTLVLDLAFMVLFFWLALGALSVGRIRMFRRACSRTRRAWAYWGFVGLYLLLGGAMVVKVAALLLT